MKQPANLVFILFRAFQHLRKWMRTSDGQSKDIEIETVEGCSLSSNQFVKMSFSTDIGSRESGKEKYNIYNSLAVLIKAVVGQKTTVDLRNESTITGIVEQSDGCVWVLRLFPRI